MTDSKQELTAERLREVLNYDAETGIFTWLARTRNRVAVGDVAGSPDRYGYLRIKIDGRIHSAHRLAWLYVHGEWPKDQLDHINGIRTDNRITNLREATNAENGHNRRKPHSNNTTGYLGVKRDRGRFQALIRLDGKQRYLGLFDTPEAAHAAYLEAKRRLHPFGNL